jgi:hypothetical protein
VRAHSLALTTEYLPGGGEGGAAGRTGASGEPGRSVPAALKPLVRNPPASARICSLRIRLVDALKEAIMRDRNVSLYITVERWAENNQVHVMFCSRENGRKVHTVIDVSRELRFSEDDIELTEELVAAQVSMWMRTLSVTPQEMLGF